MSCSPYTSALLGAFVGLLWALGKGRGRRAFKDEG